MPCVDPTDDAPPMDRPAASLPLPGGVTLLRRTLADAAALMPPSASLDHLRPWMPWAAEAPTAARTEEQSRAAEALLGRRPYPPGPRPQGGRGPSPRRRSRCPASTGWRFPATRPSPSAAVPRALGYRLDRTEHHEVTAPAETGRRMVRVRRAE